MLKAQGLASRLVNRHLLAPKLLLPAQMPKRKVAKASAEASEPEAGQDELKADASEAKPEAKRRKPTQKQVEEAEAAARPRYDESLRPGPSTSATFNIVNWNVASLNSTLNKAPMCLKNLVEKESAHAICLQETKLQSKATEEFEGKLELPGWHYYWACSETKKGYSGTAIFTKDKPISAQIGMKKAAEHDEEGRLITLEFDAFFLVNVYTPNAGEGLKRLEYKVQKWDPAFAEYISELDKRKPVVITGDLNCAHKAIDVHSPWTNKKTPGFTEEERDSFEKNMTTLSLTDCFRHQYPDTVGYTYWSLRSGARAKNKGWRLDYFLVTKALVEKLHDCYILKSYEDDRNLSDHCPIGLALKT